MTRHLSRFGALVLAGAVALSLGMPGIASAQRTRPAGGDDGGRSGGGDSGGGARAVPRSGGGGSDSGGGRSAPRPEPGACCAVVAVGAAHIRRILVVRRARKGAPVARSREGRPPVGRAVQRRRSPAERHHRRRRRLLLPRLLPWLLSVGLRRPRLRRLLRVERPVVLRVLVWCAVLRRRLLRRRLLRRRLRRRLLRRGSPEGEAKSGRGPRRRLLRRASSTNSTTRSSSCSSSPVRTGSKCATTDTSRLMFEVRIVPGKTTTYKAELKRQPVVAELGIRKFWNSAFQVPNS